MEEEKKTALILAPLRGVTIRCFREVFAVPIREAGFTEVVTPFVTAIGGFDPLADRELKGVSPVTSTGLRVTPQFIGKDPSALRHCLERVKAAGFETADLNAGCPFPMVRNKGRGAGLLKTPDVLRQLLEVGCETMGPGNFSLKTRLGVERPDELLALLPMINLFPLRFLTVHARVARQMYAGGCDTAALVRVTAASTVPVVPNGDLSLAEGAPAGPRMIGRDFIRTLGRREDIGGYLERYVVASERELSGEQPVLGRLKELLAYWKDLPKWHRHWNILKVCRSLGELRLALSFVS